MKHCMMIGAISPIFTTPRKLHAPSNSLCQLQLLLPLLGCCLHIQRCRAQGSGRDGGKDESMLFNIILVPNTRMQACCWLGACMRIMRMRSRAHLSAGSAREESAPGR